MDDSKFRFSTISLVKVEEMWNDIDEKGESIKEETQRKQTDDG